MRELDVAIIGAGSAGLSARREVAKKTDNYLVFDSGHLGTTCARVGCMPSKVLIQAANDYHRRHSLKEQGIHGAENLSVDLKETMKHVRKLRDRFVRAVLGDMESWAGEKLINKKATLLDSHTLECAGEKFKVKKIILATGSRPNIPHQLEEFREKVFTTDSFFEFEEIPKRILVLGLGVIGLEIGQALNRLGVEVFGVNRSRRVAGISDPKLNDYTIEKLRSEFPLFFGGIEHIVEKDGALEVTLEGKRFMVDRVLVSSGRTPNIDQLALKKLGINVDDKGVPNFDKRTFQLTEWPHVFIAGDTTGTKQILHEASDEGKIAGFNAVNSTLSFKTRTPLMITFTDPNIASTGLTYKELQDKKVDFEIGEVSFEGQGRSIVKLKEVGLLRIYGERSTGKILGAEMFGPDCEHIAHLLSWVIEQDLTVNKTLSFPFYHPVIEEGLRTALRNLRDRVEQPKPFLEIFPVV